MSERRTYKKQFAFLFLAGLLGFSSFYRVKIAVIAPQLIKEFNIEAEALGLLGSTFFYTFALVQFIIGPLLDRVGPRLVILVFAFIGGCGAILFAVSKTLMVALIGRMLLGAGMGAMLMGAFKVFTIIFPPNKFSFYAGLLVSFGTIGYIFATTPFVYVNAIIGWRTTLIAAGLLTIIIAVLLFKSFKDSSSYIEKCIVPNQDNNDQTTYQSFKMVFGFLPFWQSAALSFCRYGAFVSLQGVWLALYLMDVPCYTSMESGNMLFILSVGMIVGGPFAGWCYDRFPNHKKTTIVVSLSLYSLSLLSLTGFFEIKHNITYAIIFLSLGFFGSFGVLLFSYVKELFPLKLAGTAMACLNFFIMLGGAVFMQLTGNIIQLLSNIDGMRSPRVYHITFFVCFISIIMSLIFFGFVKRKME